MITIQSTTVTPFQQNTRVITNNSLGLASIIDPGGEIERIIEPLNLATTKVESILLTHSHIDHCAGVVSLLEALKKKGQERPILYAGQERELRVSIVTQAKFFGLDPLGYDNCPEPDVYLEQGQKLTVCGISVEARFTPGHSPGHFSFVLPEGEYQIVEGSLKKTIKSEVVISGDALFSGSIGRTDFPGSSSAALLNSIRSQLFTLNDAALVLPGHGPMTTIGVEKRSNPFLQDNR